MQPIAAVCSGCCSQSAARWLVAVLAWLLRRRARLAAAAPARPAMPTIRPSIDSADLFDRAIDKVADYPPSNERLTGITVPHHLLADRLVALGFRAASGIPTSASSS